MAKSNPRANRALLQAVLEPRKPGALKAIAAARAEGADADSLCPDTSTSRGHVQGGSSLLTYSISTDASKVVAALLKAGADPNREDANGWTPWMATTLADESKRDRMQQSLLEHGGQPGGEHIGALARAIFAGDVTQAASLIQSDQDLRPLATFRVDLLGNALYEQNTAMVDLLLDNGMPATSSHLSSAVSKEDASAVTRLLNHGVAPEDEHDGETVLMSAAAQGNLGIVKQLVAAGANPNRGAHGNLEWTPASYARQEGKHKVAEWLEAQMSEELLDKLQALASSRNPKFNALFSNATCFDNQSADDIAAVLTEWDETWGVTLEDADADMICIAFDKVPADPAELYAVIEAAFPFVAEDRSSLLKDLKKSGEVTLWWDS